MIGKVIIVSGMCFGVGWWLHQRTLRAEWERARAEQEAAERAARLSRALDGVWSEPRQLINDVRTELAGPGVTAAQTSAGRVLEVPLTPKAQRNIWRAASHAAREGLAKDPQRTTRQILQALVPECDWSSGWEPYASDPRFREVYETCERMLEVAECSFKYARSGDGPAMICPGWAHEQPAPTGDLRPGDYVEVLLDAHTTDPGDEGASADWAWVRVESVPPGTEAPVAGVVSIDPPPGHQPNVIRNSASHGVQPGAHIVVPRRAVFRVVQGK